MNLDSSSLIPFSAAASPPDMSVVARPPFFPISWYPSLPNCPARAWPPRLRPAPKCSIIRMHMMSKISRSILCILHKRRCARFPDPYAYFTNYFTSFYTKRKFHMAVKKPKKKSFGILLLLLLHIFMCRRNLHTLSEMLLGFQTFASCTSLYDRLARTSSSIELLPICSRRHFGALKYIIRVRSASCALIDPHTFFVTAACYKLRYKQSFYINLSLENKTYLSRLNFSHTHTHSHIYILHRSIDQSRER